MKQRRRTVAYGILAETQILRNFSAAFALEYHYEQLPFAV